MSWERLAHVELSSAGDTIDSGTFTAKENLVVLLYVVPSGTTNVRFRFNSDSTQNYADKKQSNGGSDGGVVDQTSIRIGTGVSANQYQNNVVYISNKASKEKMLLAESIKTATGAGTTPDRQETGGKWANTSDQITSIQAINTDSGDFASGSYITVFGATSDTTTDERPSNVPANSRFEATNLRKIYRRAAGNATVETLNATNGTTNWSADTSKLTKSGNTITFSATGASNDEEIYYDLTSTSDDKWTLRFKADFTSIGAGTNATHQQLQFGIYDSTNPSGNASGDVIMFYLSSAGNVSNAVNGVNGGTSDITSTNNTPIASSGSAVTYYIELQRTSSSAIQAKVFSDEYDTQVGSTLSKTGLSGITGLRYLMVRLWSEGGAGNGAVGSVTDMKFYNDTTTPLDDRWVERNTA
jgi:hypothetical protein